MTGFRRAGLCYFDLLMLVLVLSLALFPAAWPAPGRRVGGREEVFKRQWPGREGERHADWVDDENSFR